MRIFDFNTPPSIPATPPTPSTNILCYFLLLLLCAVWETSGMRDLLRAGVWSGRA